MSEKTQHHVLPLSIYLGIGAALLVLTGITVAVAQFQLGEWNLIVAMTIAGVKATLVLLFFMHLKYDNKLYAFAFLISVAFLAVFITFTLLDTLYRDQFGRGSIDKQVPYKSAPAHPGGEAAGAAGSSESHSADSTTTTSHK